MEKEIKSKKKEQKKNKRPVLSLICYIVTAVLLVYSVYLIITGVSYIKANFAAYGMTMDGNFGQVFNILAESAMPYLVMAFLTFVAGGIYERLEVLISIFSGKNHSCTEEDKKICLSETVKDVKKEEATEETAPEKHEGAEKNDENNEDAEASEEKTEA